MFSSPTRLAVAAQRENDHWRVGSLAVRKLRRNRFCRDFGTFKIGDTNLRKEQDWYSFASHQLSVLRRRCHISWRMPIRVMEAETAGVRDGRPLDGRRCSASVRCLSIRTNGRDYHGSLRLDSCSQQHYPSSVKRAVSQMLLAVGNRKLLVRTSEQAESDDSLGWVEVKKRSVGVNIWRNPAGRRRPTPFLTILRLCAQTSWAQAVDLKHTHFHHNYEFKLMLGEFNKIIGKRALCYL